MASTEVQDTKPADEVVEEELADYDDDEEGVPEAAPAQGEKKTAGSYVGIHTSAFKDFLLKPEILRAISDCGFEHPSEVQHECIPQAILGIDILCQAKSGMGKTAVFVLSVLQQLEPENATSVMVLCHTRELALQISREFQRFSKYLPEIKTAVFYGGLPVMDHVKQLQNETPQIVVGTPGRVKDLINRGALKMTKIKYFILDECDQMLDSVSMRSDVQEIFLKTPRDKQVMMFSATMSPAMRLTCKKFMQEPHEILVDSDKLKLHGLVQHFVQLQEAEKNRKLTDLLDSLEFNQVIIFVKSNQRAEKLKLILEENKFPAVCMHAGMKQPERIDIYTQFKAFKHRILVATNLFGRGIDIERVNIVINYDMPETSDQYLHRVGRAGRFGTKGLAISFVSSPEDNTILQDVQAKFTVKITELPEKVQPSFYM